MPDRDLADATRNYLNALDNQRLTYIKTARNAPSEHEVAQRKANWVRNAEQELRDALAAHDG